MIMGELSLDGTIQPIKGALPIAIKAREEGLTGSIVPLQNAREAAVVNHLSVYGVSNIQEVIEFINDKHELTPTTVQTREEFTENLINVLEEGSDKLTLADMNEESANMLALQTRQQLAINSLSLAYQEAQSVLKLFKISKKE